MDFLEFPKMPRLTRRCIITEKLDGTNAQVYIADDGAILFGSRTRWITPEDDNYGFAAWATKNAVQLRELGPGRHFGEWWGAGIQRKYGLTEKRFSLFNVERWGAIRPACCHVVPVLFDGMFSTERAQECIENLAVSGSRAAPGFLDPEGIVIFHTAGNFVMKKTIKKDEVPKTHQTTAPTGTIKESHEIDT